MSATYSIGSGSSFVAYFVVFLEGSEIFTGLGEFAFLHTFANVPVHEGALGVHKIKLVVETRPGLSNGGGVAKHGNTSVDSGKFASGDANGPGFVSLDIKMWSHN